MTHRVRAGIADWKVGDTAGESRWVRGNRVKIRGADR